MSFPTLTSPATNITIDRDSTTITQKFDGGYKQTRERYSRDVKKFKVEYVLIDRADRDLIENHYLSVRGATPFSWTNEDDNQTYTVRYTKAPSFPATGAVRNKFTITLELEEV